MRKILMMFFILAFFVSNTLTTNALSKFEEIDSVKKVSTVNGIDTYEITEHNHKFTFTVDPVNMFVSVNNKVYTFDSYFKALEIQVKTNVSLDIAISTMDTVKPHDVLQMQMKTSGLTFSTLATNPPTSGYNMLGPEFYLWYYNVDLVLQQTCFALIGSIFGTTVLKGENHVRAVMATALSTGAITSLNVIFSTATYKRIRQATHPTVQYAVKQTTQFCTWSGKSYVCMGDVATTYFWSQQPY